MIDRLTPKTFKVRAFEPIAQACFSANHAKKLCYEIAKALNEANLKELVESKRGSMSETHDSAEHGSDSASRSFFRETLSTASAPMTSPPQ